ncbi:hypothetical protein [Streptomyces sp. ME19-01-6]|nr:hypothetical protein [Streptomyces sp. ME19-01-6]MDX3233194.1 hypothetical protein [Streptomyces sp. ME19-01-6]
MPDKRLILGAVVMNNGSHGIHDTHDTRNTDDTARVAPQGSAS